MAKRRQPRPKPWAAKRRALKVPRRAMRVFPILAEGGERMLEESEQRLCLCAAKRHFGNEPRKNAGRRAAEWTSGGIVDVDPPATKLNRNAARKSAVGGDQRGDGAVSLGRLAEQHGNGKRLFPFIRRVQNSDLRNRRALRLGGERRGPDPFLRRLRRTHRFGDETIPGLQGSRRFAKRHDIAAADADIVDEELQTVLRMPGGGRLRTSDRAPRRVVEALIEAGEHDRTVWQMRDGLQELGGRRHGPGRARRDHRRRASRRARSLAASARIIRSRRWPGSISPHSERCAGQNSVAIFRNSSVIAQ